LTNATFPHKEVINHAGKGGPSCLLKHSCRPVGTKDNENYFQGKSVLSLSVQKATFLLTSESASGVKGEAVMAIKK